MMKKAKNFQNPEKKCVYGLYLQWLCSWQLGTLFTGAFKTEVNQTTQIYKNDLH